MDILDYPLITKEEHDQIQIILGKKGRPRPRTHEFPFTGMITCGECGAMITAEDKTKRQKNGNVHNYTYYHCTKKKNPNCTQKNIKKECLEKQIIDILESIEIPSEFKEWALDVLKEENAKEFVNKEIILSSQQKNYNSCIRRINNLIDMRANEEITEEEFSKKRKELTQEKEKIKIILENSDEQVNDWAEKATQLFSFAELAKTKFENGSLEDKKTILSCLGSNLSLKDDKLSIELQKPLRLIEKASLEVKTINERLEPVDFSLDKRKMGEIYSQSPMLLRW
ncbi:MAG: zinc ribbon domain-containing protein [Candidatus Paceibacterota bacterium]